mmetsp:Transcript_12071/g.18524  ORF Transcript_12071/g.18524 Transcript_12071/m.18524 type:complete len:388 (+) Transcript_12071:186-1349(+)
MSGNEAYLQGGSSNGQGDIEMADSDDELEEDHPDDDEDDDEDVVDDSNAVPAPGDDDEEEDAAVAKRRAIQSILRDTSLSEEERRQRIQSLMSGGRTAPAPAPAVPAGVMEEESCVHYERNCSIVAPCCGRVYGCRVCHDELSGHAPLNRFEIREVVCRQCQTRQPASNNCISCGIQFGEYHCGICNLWMARSKKPFHCMECGFCRVGGVESFRHCTECCMCISVNVFNTHNCFKDKYKNNCPVCREDMFSSRQSPQDLPCGHAIHAHCFRKLAGFDYRCPICKKTVVSQQSMAAAWEARARDIAEQPMPADLQRVVDIMCNDCETKSHQRQWHFLGVQCPSCNSFNTVVEQVTNGENNTPNNPTAQNGSGNNPPSGGTPPAAGPTC